MKQFEKPEYELQLTQELKDRVLIATKSMDNDNLKSVIRELCKKNDKEHSGIVYFFNHYLFTEKNDVFFSTEMPKTIPFMLFKYQEDIVERIWNDIVTGQNVFLEKSRQMGLTWLIMGVFLYGIIFHDMKFLIISQKEEYVDKQGDMRSCFEKIRFMLRLLPNWMVPEGLTKESGSTGNKYMSLGTSSGASITWESANANAGTWGTYNAIFLDEFAKQDNAMKINTACAAATSCIIYNSTPLGEWNEYYRMRKKAMSWDIDWITIHWSLNPFYTPDWYTWKTKGMTPEKIAQELEISYTASLEWAVYKRFQPKPVWDIYIGKDITYDYTLPLFVAIDNSHGGNDNHAVIVFQTTLTGRVRVINTVQLPSQTSISDCAAFLAKKPRTTLKIDDYLSKFFLQWFVYKPASFIADPFDTHATWNDTSIYEEYLKEWIILLTPEKAGNMNTQIDITRSNLHRLDIHEDCTDFISAIQNARFPDRWDTSQSTSTNDKPIHDWTSHFRTAMEYMFLWVTQDDRKVEWKQNKQKKAYQYADPITGQLTTRYR